MGWWVGWLVGCWLVGGWVRRGGVSLKSISGGRQNGEVHIKMG